MTRMPGRWLLSIGRAVFDESVFTSVVLPAIADLQAEWLQSTTPRARLLARWRGTFAFWSLVVVSPFALGHVPAAAGVSRTLAGMIGVTAAIAVPVVLGGDLLVALSNSVFPRVPSGTWAALAAMSGYAFLAGPLAVGGLALGGRPLSTLTNNIGPATLLATLSTSIGALLACASVYRVFDVIGASGSVGSVAMTNVVDRAIQPMWLAIVATTVCLALVAGAALFTRRQPQGHLPRASGLWAIGASIALVATLLSIDQVLRFDHRVMVFLLAILGPPQPGSGRAFAGESEVVVWVMFAGALTAVLSVLLAFYAWRTMRGRSPHPLFVWVSRAALLVALVGAVWHATVAYRDFRAFESLRATVIGANPRTREPENPRTLFLEDLFHQRDRPRVFRLAQLVERFLLYDGVR